MEDLLMAMRSTCMDHVNATSEFCDTQEEELKESTFQIKAQFVEDMAHAAGDSSESAKAAMEKLEREKAEAEAKRLAMPEGDSQKKIDKRKLIRKEFISTEISFVAGLKLLMDRFNGLLIRYIEQIKADNEAKKSKIKKTKKKLLNLIDEEQERIAFLDKYYFPTLLQLHSQHELFLKYLTKASEHPQDPEYAMSNAVIDAVNHLAQPYLTYVSKYKKISANITHLINSHTGLRKEIDNLSDELLQTKHRITTLQAYLITPVQRVPRYQLLLRELEGKANKVHLEKIQEAKQVVIAMSRANDTQTKIESQLNILANHANIYKIPDLVHENRDYVMFIDKCRRIKTRGSNVKLAKCQIYLFRDLVFCVYEGRFTLIQFHNKLMEGYSPRKVDLYKWTSVQEIIIFNRSNDAVGSPAFSEGSPTADVSDGGAFLTIDATPDTIHFKFDTKAIRDEFLEKLQESLNMASECAGLAAPFIEITKENTKMKRRNILGRSMGGLSFSRLKKNQ